MGYITNIGPYIFPIINSLILSVVFTFFVLKIAPKINWISFPRSDRWHSRPVALMGGIAIYISTSITYLVLTEWELLSVWLGATIMFLIGFWDDRFEMKPIYKFLAQLIAASLLVSSGYLLGGNSWPFWISYPLTFLWIIGLTNAINLLDNMDGLAAGSALIIALLLGFWGLKFSNYSVTISSLIIAGSCTGFLFYNYNPAKVFMGDCGSLFLGYSLAGLSLALKPGLGQAGSGSLIVILMFIMILPIFDTTLVTVSRIFKGRSPSQGGKDHSSHRLVFLGLTERQAVNSLFFLAGIFGTISLFLYPSKSYLLYSLAAIGVVAFLCLGRYLFRVEVYDQKSLSVFEKGLARIPDVLKSRLQLASIIIDITLIVISLVLAHYIRFEHWNYEIETAVTDILLGTIVIKILLIATFGLYKSVWEHAGMADLLRLFAASFLGSLASGYFAWTYMGSYISVSVFAIDSFLFFFMLTSSRFAFKGLRRILAISQSQQQSGKNVVLYGAGDAGWLALSEIRQNKNMDFNLVGFIDDSPYKKNRKIQGISVLGNSKELYQILIKYDVKELLICVRGLSKDKEKEISDICNECKVSCRKFIPSFNELDDEGTVVQDKPKHNFIYES